jgi:hypothetical protein
VVLLGSKLAAATQVIGTTFNLGAFVGTIRLLQQNPLRTSLFVLVESNKSSSNQLIGGMSGIINTAFTITGGVYGTQNWTDPGAVGGPVTDTVTLAPTTGINQLGTFALTTSPGSVTGSAQTYLLLGSPAGSVTPMKWKVVCLERLADNAELHFAQHGPITCADLWFQSNWGLGGPTFIITTIETVLLQDPCELVKPNYGQVQPVPPGLVPNVGPVGLPDLAAQLGVVLPIDFQLPTIISDFNNPFEG